MRSLVDTALVLLVECRGSVPGATKTCFRPQPSQFLTVRPWTGRFPLLNLGLLICNVEQVFVQIE